MYQCTNMPMYQFQLLRRVYCRGNVIKLRMDYNILGVLSGSWCPSCSIGRKEGTQRTRKKHEGDKEYTTT